MVTRAWMAFGAVSVLALGLMAAPQDATALECSARPPQKADSDWVYRTVQGRKCWYRGPQVIPKSELIWPKHTEIDTAMPAKVRDAQAAMVTLPANTNDERHPAIQHTAAQPIVGADTFEARWRGLPR